MSSENRQSLGFKIEKLEERIAPCRFSGCPHDPHDHPCQGNNGFGNGGLDGVPGNSGKQDLTR